MLKLSIITLGVVDLQKSRQFYESIFGWKVREDNGDIVFFDSKSAGGLTVALYPWEKLAEDVQVEPVGSGFRGMTLAHNTKSKEEVHQIVEQAEKLGARVLKPPQDVFWGGYHAYVADLDDHLWEIAWNPFWKEN